MEERVESSGKADAQASFPYTSPAISYGRSAHSLLIQQLETVTRLEEDDRRALNGLPFRIGSVSQSRDVFREGQASSECCLILSGAAYRYKIIAGGRRQIVSFHFAGDMPDLQRILLDRTDHSLGVSPNCRVAFVSHAAVRAVTVQRPTLQIAFHRQALIDASIFREWIANVGRRPARERVAHVLCECYERLQALGLTDRETFELPITQSELGDATGLSSVHVNRTLQALRKSGLIISIGKNFTIPDRARLRATADFDASYLHLLVPRTV